MTTDLAARLGEVGTSLSKKTPAVASAAISMLESVASALDHMPPDRYELGGELGSGGMAEVLLATAWGANGFNRPVAIKRVRGNVPNQDKLTTTLVNEALAGAHLSHPNVISFLDLYRDATGKLGLVMEHVDGVDLATFAETGPLPHVVVVYIVHELLSGLGYLHQHRGRGRVRGLLHCDVTPRNVLLSWEGEVKLADFGVAQVLEGSAAVGANPHGGTAGYMAPEHHRGHRLDARADLYAVGVVLWELLSARWPRSKAPGAESDALLVDMPKAGADLPSVPGELEAISKRLLAHDRDERYPAAELAAAALMRCSIVSADGRGDLIRLLADRFPARRRGERASQQRSARSSVSAARTVTAPSLPLSPLIPLWELSPRLRDRPLTCFVIAWAFVLAVAFLASREMAAAAS